MTMNKIVGYSDTLSAIMAVDDENMRKELIHPALFISDAEN